MKNVMKKLFSLLLVGIVAISMFGFIAPNNVDAAEAKPSKGIVRLEHTGGWIGRYFIRFYDASGKQMGREIGKVLTAGLGKEYSIPLEAKSVIVETQVWAFGYHRVNLNKFELSENNDSSTGFIFVRGCNAVNNIDTSVNATGCWKYAGKVYHG